MDIYTSDSSDTDSREQKTLNYGRMNLQELIFKDDTPSAINRYKDIEILLLNHNRLKCLPSTLKSFDNLHILDLSSNCLTELPETIGQLPLSTLIVKNNHLTNKSLPKSFINKNQTSTLRELNLSGNFLTHIPEQVIELKNLKYLYMGGNQIMTINKDIAKMQRYLFSSSLQVLSIGGNHLTEVPDSVGLLSQLQALVLCDNLIENLPTSIANLKNLKTLLLHKNRLKHLPKDIVALKNLTELSLRDNPLVVRFVQDMTLNPPTLLELAARLVKTAAIRIEPGVVPKTILDYLSCANCCVNPQCKGVFFDNRVEHIKFVDFCGKYRVPLLQYLCSSKCIEHEEETQSSTEKSYNATAATTRGYMMRKVLLG